MATIKQFLAGTPLRPVIVISGRDATIVDLIVTRVLRRIGICTVARWLGEKPLDLIAMLYASAPVPRTVIIRDAERFTDVPNLLAPFVREPTHGVFAVLTYPSRFDRAGKRWLCVDPFLRARVLFIDCPGRLTRESLIGIAQVCGLSVADALWLTERCETLPQVLAALDRIALFPDPTEPGLVQTVVPDPPRSETFDRFDLLPTGSDVFFCQQLRHRFEALARLALYVQTDLTYQDISRRVDLDHFLVRRFMPLVRRTKPKQWVAVLAHVVRAEEYASYGFPIRAYLKAILGL